MMLAPGDPLENLKAGIVLIQDDFYGFFRTLTVSMAQSILSHPELVGVNGIEGDGLQQSVDLLAHFSERIAPDDKRVAGQYAGYQRFHILEAAALDGHGIDGFAVLLDMLHCLMGVIRAGERQQGELVSLGQVAQGEIGAHLRPGIRGIGEKLGKKENPAQSKAGLFITVFSHTLINAKERELDELNSNGFRILLVNSFYQTPRVLAI